jgi:hypothetical protein
VSNYKPFSKNGGEGEDRVSPRARLGSDDALQNPEPDPELERVLRSFRSSVHAWSDAVYQRPRLVEVAPRRMAWRKAAVWALGSVLVAGGVGGGLLEVQHRQEQARLAAVREAQHQRQLQEERAREAAQELALVDRDVSRQVPNALEPLAQLMTSDESQ